LAVAAASISAIVLSVSFLTSVYDPLRASTQIYFFL
jgi:hypothetical protein